MLHGEKIEVEEQVEEQVDEDGSDDGFTVVRRQRTTAKVKPTMAMLPEGTSTFLGESGRITRGRAGGGEALEAEGSKQQAQKYPPKTQPGPLQRARSEL